MSSVNGMHGSETLNSKIFKEQPGLIDLQIRINEKLAGLSPERKNSPKIQETLGRIESISETLASLVGETRAEIVNLYTETLTSTHLGDYSNKVAILESHQRARITNILGASNDENHSQVA
ncbi:MAG: hypothetical protein WC774_02700 [Candidatus Gracilibacteria bacterium]|jgi:hypothetical protein